MATAVQQGIDATNRAFEAAMERGDAAAMAAAYATDGQAFPPNGAMTQGRQALQSLWQGAINMGVRSVTLETIELQPAGEHVYEVGRATLRGEGGQVLDDAKFIVIWKQEGDQWKWYRDIWNSSRPAT
ncbi:MAG: DUF4440 domain-containing protein [Caldilineaceae bacterium]|nr:DUF4440 domain-containing protein [Caldilineaceae bacterium]